MSLTNEELVDKYDAMKAKLEADLKNLRHEAKSWYDHYIALYRSHAEQNTLLIRKYGLEGEADARAIIERQFAALVNMQQRNSNLRHQLDDYDQLNAAFENLRMERDDLTKRLDAANKQLDIEYGKVNRLFDEYSKTLLARDEARREQTALKHECAELDKALGEACEDLERMDDRLADALAENATLQDQIDECDTCCRCGDCEECD